MTTPDLSRMLAAAYQMGLDYALDMVVDELKAIQPMARMEYQSLIHDLATSTARGVRTIPNLRRSIERGDRPVFSDGFLELMASAEGYTVTAVDPPGPGRGPDQGKPAGPPPQAAPDPAAAG